MNFLGKIFVVLVFIMSVVFMWTAVTVYSNHKNWRTIAEQRQTQLQQSQARNDQLLAEFNRRNSLLESGKAENERQISKLETEVADIQGRRASLQAELDQLRQEGRAQTAVVQATADTSNSLASDNTQLRTDLRESRQARDQAFRTAVDRTNEMQESANDLSTAQERLANLTAEVGRMTSVLRENDIDPTTPVDAITPRVNGMVQAIRQVGGQQYIQVNIGSDDGLRQGNTVEVFRNETYLGRAEVRETGPDNAIAIVNPRFLQGRITEGDRVATRF